MISLRGIKKIYELGGELVHALDGVDLDIGDHEFVAIIGASGSGKSTLMNIIGCLDTADEGTYMIDGQDVSDLSEHDQSIMRNEKIGFIFQQFNLLPKLTAYENVELPLIYQGVSAARRRERVVQALEKVGLAGRMKHRPNQLSGGQQQRVAVARALVTQPSLILADEPTGNLDSHSTEEIMSLLKELHRSGNTLVLITHDTEIAAQAPRRVQLFDGKIISDSAAQADTGTVAAAEHTEAEKERETAAAAEHTAAVEPAAAQKAVQETTQKIMQETAQGHRAEYMEKQKEGAEG